MAEHLEVIGAGFGRTGTMSLYVALNKLGYKTHHMKEVSSNPARIEAWLQAALDRSAGRPIDWQSIFGPRVGGYTATVDWPSAAFYRELLAANPKAKVILTLRDFDSWFESVRNTIYRLAEMRRAALAGPAPPPLLASGLCMELRRFLEMSYEIIWYGTFGGRLKDKEHARQVYEAHIAEVRRTVPPGQLLEFRVAEGWAPLCDFLGKPVPEEPFPRVNETTSFNFEDKLRRKLRRLAVLRAADGAVWLAAVAAVTATVVGVVRYVGKRR